MRYEVTIVFRYRGEGEQYFYPRTKKRIIDDISKLSDVIESFKKFYTIISLNVELVENDND